MDVACQCISERLWKCLVGRYGDCFEERYKEAYDDRAYHAKGLDAQAKYAPTLEGRKGNARAKYAPTLEVREGQCTVPKRLEKYGWWKCQLSNTHISLKNSCTYYH